MQHQVFELTPDGYHLGRPAGGAHPSGGGGGTRAQARINYKYNIPTTNRCPLFFLHVVETALISPSCYHRVHSVWVLFSVSVLLLAVVVFSLLARL